MLRLMISTWHYTIDETIDKFLKKRKLNFNKV